MVPAIGIHNILKLEIGQLHKKYKYLFPTNDGHRAFIVIALGPEHLGQHTLTVTLQFGFVLVLTKPLYESLPVHAIIDVHC